VSEQWLLHQGTCIDEPGQSQLIISGATFRNLQGQKRNQVSLFREALLDVVVVVKDQLLVSEQSLEPGLQTVPVGWLNDGLESLLQVVVSQFASTNILLQFCLSLQLHAIVLSFALALCGR
jgi:hypothetical protein